MKTVHLIRHAKSSWDDPALLDEDRPLSRRGIKACRLMAAYISDAGCEFRNVFSSPANRAVSTIELLSENLPGVGVQWHIDDWLYTFSSDDLHAWICSLDDSLSDVVIVGHNPALTDLCNDLCGSEIENIPTCGYAQLVAADCSQWRALPGATLELVHFLTPKGVAGNLT